MTAGLILAGGRGSRLGPLAAQISKALVSVGQRPHLVHQVELLLKSGCDRVVVVTSPDTTVQVSAMIERSGIGKRRVTTVVQPKPLGPVDAIRVGLEGDGFLDESVIVLMSDTYLEELPSDEDTWVAVAPTPRERSFCAWSSTREQYVDGVVQSGAYVTVGAYRFEDSLRAYTLASQAVRQHRGHGEVGMAPFLNLIRPERVRVNTWLDLGDVKSLALARQTKFIARDHHTLELSPHGTITKSGSGAAFLRQGAWMHEISNSDDPQVANLVPRTYSFSSDPMSYEMEFIDLPTLAELWLYWPGRPDTWAEILGTVIDRMEPLWRGVTGPATVPGELVSEWFAMKAVSRLREYDTRLADDLTPIIETARLLLDQDDRAVYPHGDLNFNNILFSLNTGMVKLVDPRGEERLPLIAELAKLRYSYRGGFSAITHGLYAYSELLPERSQEIAAMDAELSRHADLLTLTAAEALLLLAGAPLHPETEAAMMINRAQKLMEEIV